MFIPGTAASYDGIRPEAQQQASAWVGQQVQTQASFLAYMDAFGSRQEDHPRRPARKYLSRSHGPHRNGVGPSRYLGARKISDAMLR